jgi:SAM-dependent methyltransferase
MTDAPTSAPPPIDWGIGRYEDTALQLAPAAEAVVAAAGLRAGERVVDVGCGTGNAALLAAHAGAQVLGVDPAPRLLEVARERAAVAKVAVRFEAGDAATLGVGDGEADAILSVFGVVFAPDPGAAAAELARATADGGRIVISAWLRDGAIIEINQIAATAVRSALGAGDDAPPPPFAWHDRDTLAALFAPHGLGNVELVRHTIVFTAPSAREYVERQNEHPLAVAGVPVLKASGQWDTVQAEMVAVLEAANESPDAFATTGHYVVATISR